MASEAANWMELNGTYYESRELYSLSWGIDVDTSRIAVAPFGGPVAVTRDARKIVKSAVGQARSGTVQIFNAVGAPLGKFLWDRPSRLVAFSWTEDEVLVCVGDDGAVIPYSAAGELLSWQTSLGSDCASQGVADAHIWATGLVALTLSAQLFAISNLLEPRVQRIDVPPLPAFPHAFAVFLPEHTKHGGVEVLLAVEDTLWRVSKGRAVDAGTAFGRVTHMEVTHNGALVALFSDSGRLYVVSPDLRTVLVEYDAATERAVAGGEAEAPQRVAWCGADAVLLLWPDGWHLVGPYGDAVRWPLEAPACAASEVDGLRLLSAEAHGLLRRVPEPLARCAAPGSTAPGALLLDALEGFDRGSSRSGEALRAVGGALAEASADCTAAALHAWDPAQQRALLRAAAFGAAHLPARARRAAAEAAALGAPGPYADACRTLRLLNAARHHALGGIPLTGAQFAALPGGAAGLVGRLLAARHHLLALRVCAFLGQPPARVLLHWAAAKMGASLALSDRQLLDVLMEKLRGCAGIPFGDVASEAYRRGRPRLAALLLDFEQRSGEQVPLLTSMGEDDRALAKAVESGDADLMFLALFHLFRKLPQLPAFAEALARQPEARALFTGYVRRTDGELLKSFLAAVGDTGAIADAVMREALGGVAPPPPGEAARTLEAGVAAKMLEQAAELYGKAKSDFAAGAAAEAARLTRAQLDLDFGGKDGKKGERKGLRYVGLSLAETAYALLLDGLPKQAAKLRADFRLSDRHWAWLRARAAVALRDWDGLYAQAEEKKPGTGHAALVELALDGGAPRTELARLIARVPEPTARAEFFTQASMPQQAAAALAEAAEAGNSTYARLFGSKAAAA